MSVLKNDFFTKPELYSLALVLSSLMLKHSISSTLIGVFVIISIYSSIKRKRKFKPNWFFILPISLYLLFAISTIWSYDFNQSIKGLGRTIIWMILPLTFSFNFRLNRDQLTKLFSIFTYSNLCFGVLFIIDASLRFWKTSNPDVFFYHDLVNLLNLNAIYVSSFFYISFVFLLFKKHKIFFDYISITFLSVLILALSSKVFTLITLLTVLAYTIVVLKNRLLIVSAISVSMFLFYFMSDKLIDRVTTEFKTDVTEVLYANKFTKVYPWTGTSIRLLQLRILKNQIENENILLKGFGIFASKKSLKRNHESLNTYHGFHTYNYHNTYAQMLSELGAVGLSLLIFILFTFLRLSFISSYKWLSFVASMFPIWFFTESVLWVQRGLFIFIIIYCIVAKLENTSSKRVYLNLN